jgi:hypothetical protein
MSSPAHHVAHFALEDLPTAEVDRREEVYAGLAEAVRALVDVSLAVDASPAAVAAAQASIEAVTASLRGAQTDGPLGVRHNGRGRTWSWGNAVIGPATPLPRRSSCTLGTGRDGPPRPRSSVPLTRTSRVSSTPVRRSSCSTT